MTDTLYSDTLYVVEKVSFWSIGIGDLASLLGLVFSFVVFCYAHHIDNKIAEYQRKLLFKTFLPSTLKTFIGLTNKLYNYLDDYDDSIKEIYVSCEKASSLLKRIKKVVKGEDVCNDISIIIGDLNTIKWKRLKTKETKWPLTILRKDDDFILRVVTNMMGVSDTLKLLTKEKENLL